MLKKIMLGLIGAVALLCGVIMTRPASYRVVRSATIAAPPAKVYGMISDFHRWDAWSPWAKLDPNMKVDYSGAPQGTGAIYHWIGNDDVGEGRMTIQQVAPDQRVVIDLEFLKPFESRSLTTFILEPENGGHSTKVAWEMTGENNFMSKAMTLFMSMDQMIGNDFERGLKQMAAAAAAAN
jgi:uncharacterized protein YndB with AHSA1/START domain